MSPAEKHELTRRRIEARRALAAIDLAATEAGWLAQRLPELAEPLREIAQGLTRRRAVLDGWLRASEVSP